MPKYLLDAPENTTGLQRKGLYPLSYETRHHDYILACFYLQNILHDYIAKKKQKGVEGWSKAAQEFIQQLDILIKNPTHSLRELKKCCEQFCSSLRFGLAEKAHSWAGEQAGSVLTQASQRTIGYSGQSVELKNQIEDFSAKIQPHHPIYVIGLLSMRYHAKHLGNSPFIIENYTQYEALLREPLSYLDLETKQVLHEIVYTDKQTFLQNCEDKEKPFAQWLLDSFQLSFPHAHFAPAAQRCKSRQEDYARYVEDCKKVVNKYIKETPGSHINAASTFSTLNLKADGSEQKAPLRAFKQELDQFIQSKQSGAAAKVVSYVLPQWTGVTGGRLATALQNISQQIQPYRAEYIVHEYEAKTACDQDWYAQHYEHPLKPLSLESLQVLHDIVWGKEEQKSQFITELRNYDPDNIITTRLMKKIRETYPEESPPTKPTTPSMATPAVAVPRRFSPNMRTQSLPAMGGTPNSWPG